MKRKPLLVYCLYVVSVSKKTCHSNFGHNAIVISYHPSVLFMLYFEVTSFDDNAAAQQPKTQ